MSPKRIPVRNRNVIVKIVFSLVLTIVLVVPYLLSGSGFSSFQSSGIAYLPDSTPTIPSGVQHYINVTISNSQQIDTVNPYNQKITVDSKSYSGFEASNLMNVLWFNHTGQIIPSWIQSGDRNTATSTIYWLNIADRIDGNSVLTIYMGFDNKTRNLFSHNGNEGVAPNLTSTYAQYDNGMKVFPFYSNFAGTSLSNQWYSAVIGNTTRMVVDNGITFSSSKDYGHAEIITVAPVQSSYIVETNVTSVNIYSGSPSLYADGLSNTQTGGIIGTGGQYVFIPSYFLHLSNLHKPGPYLTMDDGGWWDTFLVTSYETGILGLSWPQTGVEYSYFNGSNDVTGGDVSLQPGPTHYIWLGASVGNLGNITWHAQWVRARSSVPGNVMPSAQVGSNGHTTSIITPNGVLSIFSGIQGIIIMSLLAVIVVLSTVLFVSFRSNKKRNERSTNGSDIEFIDLSRNQDKKG